MEKVLLRGDKGVVHHDKGNKGYKEVVTVIMREYKEELYSMIKVILRRYKRVLQHNKGNTKRNKGKI